MYALYRRRTCLIGLLLCTCGRTAAVANDATTLFSQLPMIELAGLRGPYVGHSTSSTAVQLPVAAPFDFWDGSFVADDFAVASEEAIVRAKWWGSYLQKDPGEAADAFLISFANDLPPNVDAPFEHPWTPILSQIVVRDPELPSGAFSETLIRPADGQRTDELFEYEADLSMPFVPEAGKTYWLTITALVPPEGNNLDPALTWGWQNRDYSVQNPQLPSEQLAGTLSDGTGVYAFGGGSVTGEIGVTGVLGQNLPYFVRQSNFEAEHYIQPSDGFPGIRDFPLELGFQLLGNGAFFSGGDFNANGAVDQQDLDLVLLHWGQNATPPPRQWINDRPTGHIDQDELDGVLLNWGVSQSPGAAVAIPEPATFLLLLFGIFTACSPLGLFSSAFGRQLRFHLPQRAAPGCRR